MRIAFIPLAFAVFVFSGCCTLTTQNQSPNYYPAEQNDYYPAESAPTQTGRVIINDHQLTTEEKIAFRNFYGVDPQPGNYWYDYQSGLYGKAGQPAAGFIYPGHQFGYMPADASNGNSGIFLNGRELQYSEVQYFEALLGVQGQPGYYYLDSYGNMGAEGYAPFANIFSGGGSSGSGAYYAGGDTYSGMGYDWGGGGDNFWSSATAAGNSQGGCSYVNVGGEFATSGCG